jgi:hypothetical protein
VPCAIGIISSICTEKQSLAISEVMNKIMSLDSAVTFLTEAEVGLCKGHFCKMNNLK